MKKVLLGIVVLLVTFFSFQNLVFAESVCKDMSLVPTYKFIGNIVSVVKIFIPIIIIGFGMMDLFKAVVGAKPEEISKSLKSLAFRVVAGVLVFFLPAFISLIFGWIEDWNKQYSQETNSCFDCIWDVSKCPKSSDNQQSTEKTTEEATKSN